MTYALSQALRSVVIMNRQAANQPPQIIWDSPDPNRDYATPSLGAQDNKEASPAANPAAPAQRSFDAIEAYARLRT